MHWQLGLKMETYICFLNSRKQKWHVIGQGFFNFIKMLLLVWKEWKKTLLFALFNYTVLLYLLFILYNY